MRNVDLEQAEAQGRGLRGSIASAEAIVRDALARFPRLALACSFGAPSGMALLDLMLRLERTVPVYYLDTGLLFPETYALIERVARRYAIVPHPVRTELSLDAQALAHGEALWARDPDRCCALRKVEPQRVFLRDYDGWMSGVRRVDSAARRAAEPFEADGDGLTKVNPLFDWSDDELWAYVDARGVPVNPLHGDGYRSVGCMPCTRAVAQDEDARAGRWSGFAKTECGLHSYSKMVR
jgi:phosphoadenosine phosphosulfate reductase